MKSIAQRSTATLSLQARQFCEDAQVQRFALLSAAFICSMEISCIIEEYIFVALPGFRGFYWTVALVELGFFAVSAIATRWKEYGFVGAMRQQLQAPLKLYALMALLLGLSQGLGKITFRYLNYATNTVIKSGKLVPTLLISVIWLERKVSLAEWAAAVLLVLSSAFMALGEQAVTPSFDPIGLILAGAQLLCAAMQGNLQEKALKDYGASITEALACSNGFGVIVVWVAVQVSGEAGPAFQFFLSSPLGSTLVLLRSLFFFLGVVALTALTKDHGTGAATAVGTARKSLTVLFSFMMFPKPWHMNYVLGTFAFIAADLIYFQVSSARASARRKLAACNPEDGNARHCSKDEV
mmetsp:Transcript_4899/g.11594  ORF Transcript_4899/g.11594 Transcript_4899/m.11594 type:complete len:353 (-) Transcript_4899:57-1115(-)|eukprot:s439_g7.t1